jgi:hypothetical protein
MAETAFTMRESKPIPFRKSKRKTDAPSVRPRARIIRAGTVAIEGETPIRTMRSHQQRAA